MNTILTCYWQWQSEFPKLSQLVGDSCVNHFQGVREEGGVREGEGGRGEGRGREGEGGRGRLEDVGKGKRRRIDDLWTYTS